MNALCVSPSRSRLASFACAALVIAAAPRSTLAQGTVLGSDQQAYADAGNTIDALDLLCSGFRPDRATDRR